MKAEPPDLEKPTDPKQEAIQVLEEAKQHGVTYLESSSCSILTSSNITWRLYGSPLTLFIKYHNGNVAFQRSRSVLQSKFHIPSSWARLILEIACRGLESHTAMRRHSRDAQPTASYT